MKEIKITTLDNFINESNEIIKAQEQCKVAMFKLQKPIEKFLQKAVEHEIIESYKTKVNPFNQGYELKITTKTNRETWRAEESYELKIKRTILDFISQSQNIHIEPGSFFQQYFEEDTNPRIEGQSLPVFKYKTIIQTREFLYNSFREIIKSKKDIKKVIEDYIDENLEILDKIMKLFKELE